LAVTLALFAAQPVGYFVQQHLTTTPDVNNVHVARITQQSAGATVIHHVELERD